MWVEQIPHCAPTVAPGTMQKVVMVESGGDGNAVHVNGLGRQPHPATTEEAVAVAHLWIGRGYSLDLGLTQINSRNLPALRTTLEQVLGTSQQVVCANLAGGAAILTADYGSAVGRFGEGQRALQAALSAYNTGDFYRGITNGYLARYFMVPSIMPVPQMVVAVSNKPRKADTEVW